MLEKCVERFAQWQTVKDGGIGLKATGFVRRLDSVGRIILPFQLRRKMEIREEVPVEILIDGEQVVLKKYEPACFFCGNTDDVKDFRGKMVCGECATAVYEGAR